jgi:ribosome assembly protein 1
MEPLQAFHHLSQLIEQVNAILGSFIAKEVGSSNNQYEKGEEQPIDTLETHFYFSPEKRNVVFASSLDNWGFAI